MATFAAFLNRIGRELEDAAHTRISATSIHQWAIDAMRDIAVREDLDTDEQYATGVANQQAYSLPTDTVEILEVSYDAVPIWRTERYDFFKAAVNATTAGTPSRWTVQDEAMYLHPTPSVSGKEIRFFRSYIPTLPASCTSVLAMPWSSRYDRTISEYVKARSWEEVQDYDAAAHHDSLYERNMDMIANERQRIRGPINPRQVY